MKGHGIKRRVGSLLLADTLLLCGCNAGNKPADGQTKTESSVTEAGTSDLSRFRRKEYQAIWSNFFWPIMKPGRMRRFRSFF